MPERTHANAHREIVIRDPVGKFPGRGPRSRVA